MLREGIPIGELTSWSVSIGTLSSVRIPPSSTAATRELRLVLPCDLKLPALVLDFTKSRTFSFAIAAWSAKAVIGRDTMTGRVLLEGRALQIPDCGHIAESVSSMSCVHIGCGKPRSCCGSALGFRMRRLFARVKMVCRYSRTP